MNYLSAKSQSPMTFELNIAEDEDDDVASPSFTDKMPVDRFYKIIHGADKQYDVESIVRRLNPTESGHIPLKNINMFQHSLHPIFSNNKHDKKMAAMIQIGLDIID